MTLVGLLALSLLVGSMWGLSEAYKKSKWFWLIFLNSALIGLVVAQPTATNLVEGFDIFQVLIIMIPQQIGRYATRLYFERVNKGKRP